MRRHPFRSSHSCRSFCILLVVGLLVGVPVFAQAQGEGSGSESLSEAEKQEYESMLEEGKAAYANKNFEEAFQKLKKAHEIHPKSSILFNLGLISEKQGKLERASTYYQKFIEAPDVSLKSRQRASERMAAVNQILNQSGEAKTEAQKTNLMPALEAMNTDVDEEVSDSEVSDEAESGGADSAKMGGETDMASAGGTEDESGKESSNGSSSGKIEYSWPVYASYGVGTVAIATGVYTLAMTNDRIDKAKKYGARPEDRTKHLKYEQEASTYATTTAGLFIGGAALVGLGSYFLIRKGSMVERKPKSAETSESDPKFSISVGEEYTGAQLSVDF